MKIALDTNRCVDFCNGDQTAQDGRFDHLPKPMRR